MVRGRDHGYGDAFHGERDVVGTGGQNGLADLRVVREGDFLKICVADSGIGVQESDIARLFQAFTQLESVYTKGFEGTGLGLALTRQLVELHGGRVWVESEFGKGSRFSFTMPLSQAAGAQQVAQLPESLPGTGTRSF